MEERIIEDEGRTIKVRRNALGGIEDATDGALPEGGAAEGASSPDAGPGGTEEDVEFAVDFPEEEYDEDMVGLTPSQLKRAQEERERARREAEEARDKLISEGKKALSSLDYAAAETGLPFFALSSSSSFCAGSSLRFGFLTITKRTRAPKTGGGLPFWSARSTASDLFWKGKRSPPSTKSRKR